MEGRGVVGGWLLLAGSISGCSGCVDVASGGAVRELAQPSVPRSLGRSGPGVEMASQRRSRRAAWARPQLACTYLHRMHWGLRHQYPQRNSRQWDNGWMANWSIE